MLCQFFLARLLEHMPESDEKSGRGKGELDLEGLWLLARSSMGGVEAALKELGWSWPTTDANFLLADTGSVETAQKVYDGLKARGILVRYWPKRPELASKLRITIGTPESNQAMIQGVREILGITQSRTAAS